MYLPVALLVWFATLPFVISEITITVTPYGSVSSISPRGSSSAISQPPSSTAVPSMNLSATGMQSSKRMSPLSSPTTSVNFIPTPSSSGPSDRKSRTLTQELPMSEAPSAHFGTTSTFKPSTTMPAEETTSLLPITYTTSAPASTGSFSGSSAVRNDEKLASIALAFALAFIAI